MKQHPLLIEVEEFRRIGHQLIDQIAEHYSEIQNKSITPGETPATVRAALGMGPMPVDGSTPEQVLDKAHNLLMEHSLFNAHPSFWGYIMGPGTQIGTLADMLAATVNPNCGGWELAPMAAEIERQAIRWIADWINYPSESGGILVSGGAMANYVGFLTGRTVKMGQELRAKGMQKFEGRLKVYCSAETHTWIQKAADLFGLGTDSIAWIPTDENLQIDLGKLEQAIIQDKQAGDIPFMAIATAGSVSTGVVDNLEAVEAICRRHDLWFHVDGAYGAPAAAVADTQALFRGIELADSVALDPHKWFYCPQEAGCVLVRDPKHLLDTFSYRPPYYHFGDYEEEPGINFYEYGLQNSRGFRALKVWMTLLQAGQDGMRNLIANDIRMARLLFDLVDEAPDFEAFQTNLSITTFRYVPDSEMTDEALNDLNKSVMEELQRQGRAFVTNAVVNGKFLLRACVVNYRTGEDQIKAFPGVIRDTYAAMNT